MSFISIAKKRYSCRSYSSQPVPNETIEQVLEAARIAPSAVNAQPLRLIVLTDVSLREEVSNCYSRPWLKTAPVIIVACGDHSVSWRRADGKDHCDIDVAIAVDHITLAAADLGLGTCWICKFDAMKCSEILKLPAHVSPIALIPLGYPADSNENTERHTKRKPLSDLVRWNKF